MRGWKSAEPRSSLLPCAVQALCFLSALPILSLFSPITSCKKKNTLIPVGDHLAHAAGHQAATLEGKCWSVQARHMHTGTICLGNKKHSRQSSLKVSSLPKLRSLTDWLGERDVAHSLQFCGSTSVTGFIEL